MNTPNSRLVARILTLALAGISYQALAQDAEELAKKLSNPVASLISVPIQYNYDKDIGTANGHKSFINVQPVIPLSLNDDWNVISRTILPIVDQNNVAGPSGNQSGMGDILQSVFFSPKKPTSGGLIWGAGPVSCCRLRAIPGLAPRNGGSGPPVSR